MKRVLLLCLLINSCNIYSEFWKILFCCCCYKDSVEEQQSRRSLQQPLNQSSQVVNQQQSFNYILTSQEGVERYQKMYPNHSKDWVPRKDHVFSNDLGLNHPLDLIHQGSLGIDIYGTLHYL